MPFQSLKYNRSCRFCYFKTSSCDTWTDILFLIRIPYLHRDQRVVFFPVQHVNIVGKQIHHINVSEIIEKKKVRQEHKCNKCNTCWVLLFVWWDIDSICHLISFRDHFDLLGAVVDNVGPGQKQKILQVMFHELLGKVMVIGCIEGLRSHGNNIVYTGRDKTRGTQTCSGLSSPVGHVTREGQWKVQFRRSTCAGGRVWWFSDEPGRGRPPWTWTAPLDFSGEDGWRQTGKRRRLMGNKRTKFKQKVLSWVTIAAITIITIIISIKLIWSAISKLKNIVQIYTN